MLEPRFGAWGYLSAAPPMLVALCTSAQEKYVNDTYRMMENNS